MKTYLHTAFDGEIWRSWHGVTPTQTYVHNLENLNLTPHCDVYVIGAYCNADLIAALYKLQRDGDIATLRVCSPVGCTRKSLWHDPASCLAFARKLELPASLGGYHVVTDADYYMYAMASATHADRVQLAKLHPAWAHAAFLACGSEAKLAGMFQLITDPRWYVSTRYPHRLDRLYAWLGLDPHTQSGVLDGVARGRYHSRCRLVQEAWWPSDLLSLDATTRAGQNSLPVNCVARRANAAVYRKWAQLAVAREPVYAALRASQYFVKYVCLGWAATWSSHPDAVFCPTSFFGEKDLACKAYRELVNQQ